MKALLNRIFNHSVTQPGMSLKQYAMVLLPLVAGALLKDPGKTA